MKDAEDFTDIDVAMDVIQHSDTEKYLVLEKGHEYQRNRERYNPDEGGVPWEIPGGKIELPGEEYTNEQIKREAWRELSEETSLPVERQVFVEEALKEDTYPGEQEEVDITFYPVFYEYSGDPEAVEISPEEHEAYEWISEDEFMDRMTENEKEALKQFN